MSRRKEEPSVAVVRFFREASPEVARHVLAIVKDELDKRTVKITADRPEKKSKKAVEIPGVSNA